MCRMLEVSESGFHAWAIRPPSARKLENARLEIEVLAAHQRTRETYGAERLHSDLADHSVHITGTARMDEIRTTALRQVDLCTLKVSFWYKHPF